MNLDELEARWAEHDRKLDRSIRLNRQLLGSIHLERAQSTLQRQIAPLALEATLTLVAIIALGAFLYRHVDEARFALPAMALQALGVGILIDLIRQIVAIRQIDYGQPVSAIQRRLEGLRLMRIRHVRWVLLVATLAWTPALIVTLQGFLGLDVYRLFGAAWVSANLLLGLAIIPLGIWVSKRFGERMGRSPFVRQLMDDIAGNNLNAAKGFLATLAAFERDEPAS